MAQSSKSSKSSKLVQPLLQGNFVLVWLYVGLQSAIRVWFNSGKMARKSLEPDPENVCAETVFAQEPQPLS